LTTIDEVRRRAELDARARGYHLTPDPKLLGDLLEGLRVNEERYGYPSCPCRIAAGDLELDRDIVCPCDYRDPDVEEHGSCFCCLYVDDDIHEGRRDIQPIPERRSQERQMRAFGLGEEEAEKAEEAAAIPTKRRLHYCRVCGYVVFRDEPPYVCPICRAKREMFAEIAPSVEMRTK
jgi:ferredoxin-thioredoxin reductase catalytic chain